VVNQQKNLVSLCLGGEIKVNHLNVYESRKDKYHATLEIISLIGVLAMSGSITWAVASGNFSEEGGKLLSMPWGIVSMVDLYVGFTLFSCWIVYRDKVLARSVV